jgi:hypothetical protein
MGFESRRDSCVTKFCSTNGIRTPSIHNGLQTHVRLLPSCCSHPGRSRRLADRVTSNMVAVCLLRPSILWQITFSGLAKVSTIVVPLILIGHIMNYITNFGCRSSPSYTPDLRCLEIQSGQVKPHSRRYSSPFSPDGRATMWRIRDCTACLTNVAVSTE